MASRDVQEHLRWLWETSREALAAGDLEEAFVALTRHNAILEQVDPESLGMAIGLGEVGYIESRRGRYREAIPFLERCVMLRHRLGMLEPSTVARMTDLGLARLRLGEVCEGRRMLLEAEGLAAKLGIAGRDAALVQEHLATVALQSGRLDEARYRYVRALEEHRRLDPESRDVVLATGKLGLVARREGKLDEAERLYRWAVRIERRDRPRSKDLASMLQTIGVVEAMRGHRDDARATLTQAHELFLAVAPLVPDHATCMYTLSGVLNEMGEHAEAAEAAERAIAIAREASPWALELGIALNALATARSPQGRIGDAIKARTEAVAILERYRAAIGRTVSDEAFADLHTIYARLVADLAVRDAPGDSGEAFAVVERSRARVLTELLAERDVDIRASTSEQAELLAQERELRDRAASLHNQIREAEYQLALAAEKAAVDVQLSSTRARMRAAFPAYAELAYPEPAALSEAQAQLPPDTLLLEYCVTPELICVFAVRRDAVWIARVDIGLARLGGLVREAVGPFHLGRPASGDAHRGLGRLLLDGVPAAAWEGAARVVISPDGPLHYLPFELLTHDGALVADGPPVAYAPSATVRRMLLARHAATAGDTFVGFGDAEPWSDRWPALAHSGPELERVAARFGERATVYRGSEATERRVRESVANYRYVHFATHGYADDADPLMSGLVLSRHGDGADPDGDGWLQAFEMFELPLDGAVVVCSACETGLGRNLPGEGLIGLSRALLYAGAQSLVLSLWSVSDAATAWLMDSFYGFLIEGHDVAPALRSAKAQARAEGMRDPFLWAPFVVLGCGWEDEAR